MRALSVEKGSTTASPSSISDDAADRRPIYPGSGSRTVLLLRPVLDELPAEAALDAQVAVGDVVVERRGDLDDRVVLDVQLRACSRRRSRGRSCRSRSAATRPRCRPARMSCSLLNISAPVGQTPMQLPQ